MTEQVESDQTQERPGTPDNVVELRRVGSEVDNQELAGFQQRLERASQRIGEIKADKRTDGGSSFYDVVNNLLQSANSCYRFLASPDAFEDEDAIDDMKELSTCVELLEKYLGVLDAHEDAMALEITARDGADPELRNLADEKKAKGEITRPIVWYVNELARKYSIEDARETIEGQQAA